MTTPSNNLETVEGENQSLLIKEKPGMNTMISEPEVATEAMDAGEGDVKNYLKPYQDHFKIRRKNESQMSKSQKSSPKSVKEIELDIKEAADEDKDCCALL